VVLPKEQERVAVEVSVVKSTPTPLFVEDEETTIEVSQEESNQSVLPPVVITTTGEHSKLQLAELEKRIQIETLAMQSKHDLSLKKLEANRAKILKEKEVALAKLESKEKMAMSQLQSKEALAKVDAQNRHSEALAKLASQKELSANNKELDKVKSSNEKEIALAKFQAQKDMAKNEEKIALARLANEKELVDKNIAFYKTIAMMITGILLLALLILFFINRRKRKNELQIHEDALRHKEYLEANKMHNEHIKKMLDIITDESADKGVKKEIVRLLKEQGKKGNIIEYKR
jgi:hypothetical protein